MNHPIRAQSPASSIRDIVENAESEKVRRPRLSNIFIHDDLIFFRTTMSARQRRLHRTGQLQLTRPLFKSFVNIQRQVRHRITMQQTNIPLIITIIIMIEKKLNRKTMTFGDDDDDDNNNYRFVSFSLSFFFFYSFVLLMYFAYCHCCCCSQSNLYIVLMRKHDNKTKTKHTRQIILTSSF